MYDESVLVFPRAKLMPVALVPGVHRLTIPGGPLSWESLPWSSAEFLDRNIAEKDENWLQVIPYVLVMQLDLPDLVFAYRRTKGSGESRLVNKMAIGIGGHINTEDMLQMPGMYESMMPQAAVCQVAYEAGLLREILEEISFRADGTNQAKGTWLSRPRWLVYDDSDEVGRVHIGLVHILQVPNLELVQLGTKDMDLAQLLDLRDPVDTSVMENWSRLVWNQLVADKPAVVR